MENNLLNQIKFNALYWGQEVAYVTYPHEEGIIDHIADYSLHYIQYLELKPLSSVIDKDAIKLGYGNAKHLLSNILYNRDELRQLGYALDWCGLSVEKQIEYGWIKLK